MTTYDRPRFLVAITALVYVFLFAPIAVVVLFSFNGARSLQVLDGLSTRWYEEFWHDDSLRESLFASIEIAAITTVVATALGTGLALGTMRSRGRAARGTALFLLIPLVTPEIVAGVSAFVLFAQLERRALADHGHTRPHHVLDLVRDDRRARAARLARPGARGGRARPGRDPVAGGPARHAAGALAGGARRRD